MNPESPAYTSTNYIIGENMQFYLTYHSTTNKTGKTLDEMIIEKAKSKGYPIYSRKDVQFIPPFIFGQILKDARAEF